MLLLGKIMILQGVGHPISCLGVCYANDPKKGGYMTPAPALDLTTSLRGDFQTKILSIWSVHTLHGEKKFGTFGAKCGTDLLNNLGLLQGGGGSKSEYPP